MVFFGVEMEPSKEGKAFVSFVRDNEGFKSSLKGSIATRERDGKLFVFVEMSIPKLPWWAISIMTFLVGYVLGAPKWSAIVAVVFMGIELLYTRFLWYGIFSMGMRKKGYNGKKHLMGVGECLGWLVR